jgi:hypothetical protein
MAKTFVELFENKPKRPCGLQRTCSALPAKTVPKGITCLTRAQHRLQRKGSRGVQSHHERFCFEVISCWISQHTEPAKSSFSAG